MIAAHLEPQELLDIALIAQSFRAAAQSKHDRNCTDLSELVRTLLRCPRLANSIIYFAGFAPSKAIKSEEVYLMAKAVTRTQSHERCTTIIQVAIVTRNQVSGFHSLTSVFYHVLVPASVPELTHVPARYSINTDNADHLQPQVSASDSPNSGTIRYWRVMVTLRPLRKLLKTLALA
jgi:hypothetical protein